MLKVCSKCGLEKDLEQFFNYRKKANGELTKRPSCKVCERISNKNWQQSNKEKVSKGVLSYYYKNKEKVLKRQKIKAYNITENYYEHLKSVKLCEICQDTLEQPNIDHNHKTGEVRGVLCRSCNLGLGFFKDSMDNLEKARKYLFYSEVYGPYEQASTNSGVYEPVVVIQGDRKKPLALLDLDHFIELIKRNPNG